ncbi:hypothetical protein M378DRAFT_170042 [Amanita muscaria Koide BX008]|uniref:C2H2-type domain-containing protein n=1 Tax=Amanita muscaria (strain Koide BX008) TaxID=946122 RepID=A0A0C2WC31_AMAMK|nr:hypothetical protein M378DRAFT_170042 [Amanita muscaria Koide BX008]
MSNSTELKPGQYNPTPSIFQPAPTSPGTLLQRKEPPSFHEYGQKPVSPAPVSPAVTDTQEGEYEKCCITSGCEVCGMAPVGFWDEEIGGFTLKDWEAHRLTCSMPGQYSSDPVIYTPESTVLAHPQTKRRREKRTEEERINYLRADPYVAQFEAYRVLCACCDKWIRLRSNSTYCSIPWNAHRKSCLAKKVKNVYPLEERNACHHTSDNPSFHGRNPSNYAPIVESTRRNAWQRTATLGGYSLISEDEPNRVFCQRWVQPRQDSSHCNYPCLQHRRKCLARHTSGKPSFKPSYADHQRDTGVGSIQQSPKAIALVNNLIYEADCFTLAEDTNKPPSTNVYNEGIAQRMSETGLAAANYHMPDPVHRVGNSHTLTGAYNPELQTLFRNNMQPSYHPSDPVVDSTAQSLTMAVGFSTAANYDLTLTENTSMYSRVSVGNTVNWHCNFSGCQYTSRSKRDMERHCSNLSHGGCREHKCEYCGKVFVRADTLSRHVRETSCWLRQA